MRTLFICMSGNRFRNKDGDYLYLVESFFDEDKLKHVFYNLTKGEAFITETFKGLKLEYIENNTFRFRVENINNSNKPYFKLELRK